MQGLQKQKEGCPSNRCQAITLQATRGHPSEITLEAWNRPSQGGIILADQGTEPKEKQANATRSSQSIIASIPDDVTSGETQLLSISIKRGYDTMISKNAACEGRPSPHNPNGGSRPFYSYRQQTMEERFRTMHPTCMQLEARRT